MIDKEWIEPSDIEVPEELVEALGGHPLVGRVLARRGFTEIDTARAFLDPDFYRPEPAIALPGMDAAVTRLEDAVRRGERVCVWGDFDVDGQTSTALLVSMLEELGAKVQFYIPDRLTESHGVHLSSLADLIEDGIDLVVTCDTGVTSHEPISYARERGVDFVVTDHHDLPSDLPTACAVVNPKRLPIDHPLRELPGVGCAYKLAEEMYSRLGRAERVESLLDLVALGIVADIAVQVDDTRYLLQRGLALLRRTERCGLRVMMEALELDPTQIDEDTIGYVLGPRLNSLGRLGDASVAVELLTTNDKERARILFSLMEGLNAERRQISEGVLEAALRQVDSEPTLLDYSVLVLSHPTWHAGVVGVVASRLAHRYRRPVVMISAPPGQMARGSVRSIEGCDIMEALSAHADVMERFGGHPMAAGLSIDPERIPEFRRAISATVAKMLEKIDIQEQLRIDGYLKLDEISLDLVRDLGRMAPFGPGNPQPTLVTKDLVVAADRLIGSGDDHRLLIVEDQEGNSQKVVWWQGADTPVPEGRFDLAYFLRKNEYRGQLEVQLEWQDARLVDVSPMVVAQEIVPEVEDYRQDPAPRESLNRLLKQQGELQIWAEAEEKGKLDARDRRALEPSDALVVWTIPPGPEVLRVALETTSPRTVHLFAIDPDLDTPESYLERLVGLIIHSLRNAGGEVSVAMLAAATAQREETVRAGVAWCVAKGHFAMVEEDGDRLKLAPGDSAGGQDATRELIQVKVLLEEAAAYRAYYLRADVKGLLGPGNSPMER